MAIKDKVSSDRLRALFARLGIWAALSLCAVLLALVWLSGAHDTKEAMLDGRRLIINLETGAIEGKQVALEPPETTPPPPVAATPVAPAAATGPAAAEATAPAASEPAAEREAPAPESAMDATAPAAELAMDEATAPAQSEASVIRPSIMPLADVQEAMLEKTPTGNLPVIGPKDQKPWRTYAKPYAHKGHLPTIAIVMTGLGQNKSVTDAAMRLPENISLSFSPYARELTSWAHAARVSGHEILIDLPLEPSNFPASDPGPYGLLAGKGTVENGKRLDWIMSRTEGYIGFVTPLNEAFSGSDNAFKDMLERLEARGLMIAMSHDPASTDTKKILDASKAAYTIADIVIDEELSAIAIQAKLQSLEQTASKRGFAVGMGQGYPLTVQQLALWTAQLEKDGFVLVPLSFITKIRFPAS